jgi:hypothetical protein
MPIIERNGGRGVTSLDKRDRLHDVFSTLQRRMKHVRALCGDWSRALQSVQTMTNPGTPVGAFLDPPYPDDWGGSTVYAHDSDTVADEVFHWCRKWGDDERFRIAVCGYEGAWEPPDGWEAVAWKANGGYANQSDSNENAHRERVWFSPHCHGQRQRSMFG